MHSEVTEERTASVLCQQAVCVRSALCCVCRAEAAEWTHLGAVLARAGSSSMEVGNLMAAALSCWGEAFFLSSSLVISVCLYHSLCVGR